MRRISLFRVCDKIGQKPACSATEIRLNLQNKYSYSKTCLKRPLKNRKTKVLTENGSLMKVQSIAECSIGALCNMFDLHLAIISIENQFLVFFLSGRLRQVVLYYTESEQQMH